ncbi:helix-turn-helix transcriptional regulator [Listeria booriae]|uniref:helix-turn-helix domain-containing protein n=1 Tax=Listeria booriae TaxID=1552123 RepID=UPI001628F004|nr:helix-turn-helix transcriptional regulator [Listeria booriae]MBC1286903.1 helix-turn-helix transcriptional regulator [Listeria booriae]
MIVCNLNVLMAERGLKISDVAKRTGISRTTLTALAHNKFKGVQLETMDSLCDFFKITTNELLIYRNFNYSAEITHRYRDYEFQDNRKIPYEWDFLFSTPDTTDRVYIIDIRIEIDNVVKKIDDVPVSIYFTKDEQDSIVKVNCDVAMEPGHSINNILDDVPTIFKTQFQAELTNVIRDYAIIYEQPDFADEENRFEHVEFNIYIM